MSLGKLNCHSVLLTSAAEAEEGTGGGVGGEKRTSTGWVGLNPGLRLCRVTRGAPVAGWGTDAVTDSGELGVSRFLV